MAGNSEVSVDVLHAFGSHCGSLRDAVLFADESGQFLVHPAGRHIAFRSSDSGETSFSIADAAVESITACAISRDKSFLAICERRSVEPVARVSIYDLRQPMGSSAIKTVEPIGNSNARLVGAAFSADGPGQFLGFISGGAEATLTVLDWQDNCVLGKCKVEGKGAERVAFSPREDSSPQISVSGPRFLRLSQLRDGNSKIRESSLKALPAFSGLDEESVRITDHAWVEPGDGTLVACLAEGSLIVLSSAELCVQQKIGPLFHDESGPLSTMPACVRCFSQGFLVGGGDGMVAVWEKVDNPEREDEPDGPQEFRHAGTMRVRQTEAAVCCLDMGSAEESLLVGFRNADFGVIPMASLYLDSAEKVDCVVASGGFHSGPIMGLDIAVQRPLVASFCKKDFSVRIWNYATKQCELCLEFPGDPPTGLALHPFGYFLAVSFGEKLRFFNVLAGELKPHSELAIRGVRSLCYANGGHLLAAAQGKQVHLISMRTLSKVVTLPSNKSTVSALCFDPEDHTLWTCSQDGIVCEFDTQTWTKADSYEAEGCEYLAASSGSGGVAICTAAKGSRCYLQRFKRCSLEAQEEFVGGLKLNALCHHAGSAAAMFAGTSTGALRVFPSQTTLTKYTELGLHVGACRCICLSVDGRTLITGGEDGTIFVLGVSGLAPGDEEAERGMQGAEVVLINRAEIQRRQEECLQLQAETSMFKARIVAEAASLQEACDQKVAEARQKDQADIQELSRRCSALEQASIAKERESERIMRSMQNSHAQAADQLEGIYKRKISHEGDRLLQLEAERIRLQEQIEETRWDHQQQLQREAKQAREELERHMAEKDLEIQKHKDLIAFAQYRFDSMLDRTAEDHDRENDDVRVTSQEVLLEQKQVETRLRAEQEDLMKGLELKEQERARVEKEQQETAVQIKGLREQIEELQRTLSSLKVERKERESTLCDKELKIDSYKVKVNTLKKFKHILDKRLAEVTQSLQPKDSMIAQLNGNLRELETEFEKQLVDQRTMEGAIEQRKQQIDTQTSEKKQLQSQIDEKDRIINSFTNDLHGLVVNQKDTKLWPQEIRRLYHVHVLGERSREERLPLEEMQVQKFAAERRITSLAARGGQLKATCKCDIQRKAHESATLVQELNQLRVQKKSMQSHVKALQLKLAKLESEEASASQPQQLALERPVSAPRSGGATTSPVLVPGGAPAVDPPRPGSGLPGPRQNSSKGLRDTADDRKQSRTRSVPPLGPKTKGSAQDQKRLQSLQLTAELNSQQLQMQKVENKLIRSQIEDILLDRKGSGGGASSGDGPATAAWSSDAAQR